MFGRAALLVAVIVLVDPLRAAASSSCLSITEAGKHIGATRCVVGKVIRVKQGNRGVHFFDFCEDYRTCPFTVVVFSGDLKQIGDVRQLVGRQIEIDGGSKATTAEPKSCSVVWANCGETRPAFRRCRKTMTSKNTEDTAQERSATPSNPKRIPKEANAPSEPARPKPARVVERLTCV